MSGPPVAPRGHYVPPNEACRMPRRFLVLDSEASEVPGRPGERLQTFRCAVTLFVRQRSDYCKPRTLSWADHATPESVWIEVDRRAEPSKRLVLVAHNLAYDLIVCDAFTWLPKLGWECESIRLDHGHAYAVWRNGKRSLTMVDSLSWVAESLDKIATDVGMAKLDLPPWGASDEAWLARCRRDVEILWAAWVTIMDWLEKNDMGNWRPTGAGMAWANWRHKHMTHRVLVHGQDELREIERRANWAGRCEVWRHGRLPYGTYTEMDFTNAYATLALEHGVPTKLVSGGRKFTETTVKRLSKRYCVLVEGVVSTSVPVVPAAHESGICWPVGRFESTLWEPELSLLWASGGSIDPSRVWYYKREPALQAWATWTLNTLDGAPEPVHPLIRKVVKNWARALIGKFGTRYSDWEDFGEALPGVAPLFRASIEGNDRTARVLNIGNRTVIEGACQFSQDAAPQVTSYISSLGRVRIWEAMNHAGFDNVMYVDTDSILVNSTGLSRLSDAPIPGLRAKGQWHTVELLAPRQIVLGGTVRAAGVPRDARPVGRRAYVADVWSSLPGALGSNHVDTVKVQERRVRLTGKDRRREHKPKGVTAPVRLSL